MCLEVQFLYWPLDAISQKTPKYSLEIHIVDDKKFGNKKLVLLLLMLMLVVKYEALLMSFCGSGGSFPKPEKITIMMSLLV